MAKMSENISAIETALDHEAKFPSEVFVPLAELDLAPSTTHISSSTICQTAFAPAQADRPEEDTNQELSIGQYAVIPVRH